MCYGILRREHEELRFRATPVLIVIDPLIGTSIFWLTHNLTNPCSGQPVIQVTDLSRRFIRPDAQTDIRRAMFERCTLYNGKTTHITSDNNGTTNLVKTLAKLAKV